MKLGIMIMLANSTRELMVDVENKMISVFDPLTPALSRWEREQKEFTTKKGYF